MAMKQPRNESSWILSISFCVLLSPTLQVESNQTNYLLYSVNPGEGFNLRRDVYMRAATLVKELRKVEDWVLVLPPWPHLNHWRTKYLQSNLKWEQFFDLPSLNEYVPVIEFDDYLEREGRTIDEVRVVRVSMYQQLSYIQLIGHCVMYGSIDTYSGTVWHAHTLAYARVESTPFPIKMLDQAEMTIAHPSTVPL